MTVNFNSKRVAATDIISLIFYPEQLFSKEESEVLRNVGARNTTLHLEYGLDNRMLVTWQYRGWNIEGVPDQVLDDMVVEGKVVSRYSNVNMLAATAWLQAFIYAKALGFQKFRIVLFDTELKPVLEKTFNVRTEERKALFFIDRAIGILEEIKRLYESGRQAHNLINQNSLLEVEG